MEWILWIACPNEGGDGWEDWYPSRFGVSTADKAHAIARDLRSTYHGHYVAVTKGYRQPLPIKA